MCQWSTHLLPFAISSVSKISSFDLFFGQHYFFWLCSNTKSNLNWRLRKIESNLRFRKDLRKMLGILAYPLHQSQITENTVDWRLSSKKVIESSFTLSRESTVNSQQLTKVLFLGALKMRSKICYLTLILKENSNAPHVLKLRFKK